MFERSEFIIFNGTYFHTLLIKKRAEVPGAALLTGQARAVSYKKKKFSEREQPQKEASGRCDCSADSPHSLFFFRKFLMILVLVGSYKTTELPAFYDSSVVNFKKYIKYIRNCCKNSNDFYI